MKPIAPAHVPAARIEFRASLPFFGSSMLHEMIVVCRTWQ
jgi:hypothetical protein